MTTTSAKIGSKASSSPRTSLSPLGADHADQPAEAEGLADRLGRGPRARRVVRGVQDDGRAAPYDFQAAGRGDRGEGAGGSCRCRAAGRARRRCRRTPRPRRAPPPRCAPGGRRAAAGRPPRTRRRGRAASAAARRPRPRGETTPNSMPSRATVASTSTALFSSTCAASTGCWARTTVASCLMIPAFSPAISPGVSPSRSVWSSAMGVTTATEPSITFVASQLPPMPTSTTATSTGASAKAAYAMPVSTSKNDSRYCCWASTISTYGLMSW